MNFPARLANAGLVIFISLGAAACSNEAAADTIIYRFEAERRATPMAPPAGSMTVSANQQLTLSGTFGFKTTAPAAAGSGIPGQVEFEVFETGFIRINEIDTGVPEEVIVQVTDGETRVDDPRMTMRDNILLSASAVSSDAPEGAPIDAITVQLDYANAEGLKSAELPTSLDLDDIAKMSLRFSTRVASTSDRAAGETASGGLLGLVYFNITSIERIE